MRAAGAAMLGSSRSLVECCAAAGLAEMDWHTARDDAMAAAALLGYLLEECPDLVHRTAQQLHAARWKWPSFACGVAAPMHRTPIGHVEPHFLARIVERMPRDENPIVDDYLAMLDAALLDRQISDTEADALIDLAHDLGLHKADAVQAHHAYLRALVRAAWEDGVISPDEHKDIHTVATLLGLSVETADQVLAEEQAAAAAEPPPGHVTPGGLTLQPGDKVVLTGDMELDRREITEQATAAGLRVTGAVSQKTRVVAAADPDSLAGKAAKARQVNVPIVSEHAFMRALLAMSPAG